MAPRRPRAAPRTTRTALDLPVVRDAGLDKAAQGDAGAPLRPYDASGVLAAWGAPPSTARRTLRTLTGG